MFDNKKDSYSNIKLGVLCFFFLMSFMIQAKKVSPRKNIA